MLGNLEKASVDRLILQTVLADNGHSVLISRQIKFSAHCVSEVDAVLIHVILQVPVALSDYHIPKVVKLVVVWIGLISEVYLVVVGDPRLTEVPL